MNYEEKYKEAIESIKRIYNQADSYGKELMEKEFHELRESEDERIRKEIIQSIKDNMCVIHKEKCLSWLEKQGEKKDTVTPQWMVDFLKDHRRHFATPMDYDEKKETDGKLLAVIKWLEGNPQLEQNHAWSEKDEKMLNSIIEEIRPFGECPDYPTDEDREYYYNRSKMIDWLESLKPNHWKPSKEQMEALKKRTHGLHTSSETRKSLESLINDLEKLRLC